MAAEPHQHADNDSFYLDQLCLIGISGAFAAICLTLYFVREHMLIVMFGPLNQTWFGVFTLGSGVALLILVAVRAVAVWRSVGDPALRDMHANHDHGFAHHPHMHPHDHEHGPCGHDHDHGNCGHDHGHTHAVAGVSSNLPQSTLDPASAEKPATPTGTPTSPHAHDHDHGHTHDPDDHDHSWAPWRYAVLLVPIALYLLGLPNQGRAVKGEVDTTQEVANLVSTIALGPNPLMQVVRLGATLSSQSSEVRILINQSPGSINDLKPGMKVFVKEVSNKEVSGHKIVGSSVDEILDEPSALGKTGLISATVKEINPQQKSVTLTVDRQGTLVTEHINLLQGPVVGVDFKTLEAFAFDEARRNKWEGKMVQVVGQFAPPTRGGTQFFSLARYRIQCCVADAVQLNVPIVATEPITAFEVNQWVQVTGRVEFRKMRGRWNTVLFVDRANQVTSAPPEPEIYIR